VTTRTTHKLRAIAAYINRRRWLRWLTITVLTLAILVAIGILAELVGLT